MSQYSQSVKNPPWARSGQGMNQGSGVAGALMTNPMPQMTNQMLQYPQVFQGQQATINMAGMAGMQPAVSPMQAAPLGSSQMYGGVGAVSYPTRALNAAAFSTTTGASGGNSGSMGHHVSGGLAATNMSPNPPAKTQRVFTGTITKIQDNFGFVDDDVFFQTSCCVKGSSPQVGDRVLVEAVYNSNMPFKWNATRIQVLSNRVGDGGQSRFQPGYNAVPPPSDGGNSGRFSSGGGGSRFSNNNERGRSRDDRSRNRKGQSSGGKMENDDRKRKRDGSRDRSQGRDKDRGKSPLDKRKSKSPLRKSRAVARRPPPRYSVVVPKISLLCTEGDVVELKKRYTNLYIPSDFFLSKFKWNESFPPARPLSLNFPVSFHVMSKEVDPVYPNDAVLEPPDVDYSFVAKVMLLASPGLEELYSRAGCSGGTPERENSMSEDGRESLGGQSTHPSRLLHFLVGTRGKETMAIGGPWSPSLDGEDPMGDPSVLVKTAIRTCKALTGVDLSACTQWFRFVEVYYYRGETVHRGKTVPARIETVVLFVADVWSCGPSRLEWDSIASDYRSALERKLNPSRNPGAAARQADQEPESKEEEGVEAEDQVASKKEPTHFSLLDPKTMKVTDLRDELEARLLSSKGLKSQLVARLSKAIKSESEDSSMIVEEVEEQAKVDKEKEESTEAEPVEDPPNNEETYKMTDKEKAVWEKRFRLPDNPHIVVHPNRTAKSGKFDCSVISLSSLLGYRHDDTKEHSFEVSLFAELFNEMLMRDFGFNIYRSLLEAPEKPKEKEEDKKKEKSDKKDDEVVEELETEDNEEKIKKEDKKIKIVDRHLLLSFSYFDTTHCLYVHDKDMEELIFSLGLSLSRSQIKKLVLKVSSRDSIHYMKLAEKVKEENEEDNVNRVELPEDLSLGNRRLFPLLSVKHEKGAEGSTNVEEDFSKEKKLLTFNGTLIDIGKVLEQLNKSEKIRIDTEKSLTKLRLEYNKAKDGIAKSDKTIKELTTDMNNYREKLATATKALSSVQGNEKLYLNTLTDIHSKIGLLINDDKRKSNLAPESMDVVELAEEVENSSK